VVIRGVLQGITVIGSEGRIITNTANAGSPK
jgi:hypothetical protein